jgi:hypothetical protein
VPVRGRPFPKGTSGNPKGRRVGALHRLILEGRSLASKEGPKIVERIAKDAKAGDPSAQRLFMQFLYPRSRIVDQPIERPALAKVEDAIGRIAEITAAMEAGKLSLDEGAALVDGAKAYVEAVRTGKLEGEVEALRGEVARLMALIERQVGSGLR